MLPVSAVYNEKLNNYHLLAKQVDELCRRIGEEFGSSIACRRGCDDCCRHLSLFPVEGAMLAAAVAGLPAAEAEQVRRRARASRPDGPCPLLEDGACLLYEARPLICRTHGMPLLATGENGRSIDFCPRNFQGTTSLPGRAVIDIDRLNETLSAVNTLFVTETCGDRNRAGERITIAEALLAPGQEAGKSPPVGPAR